MISMLNLRSSSKPVYLSFTALKFRHRRHIYLNYHKRPKKSDSKKSSPEKPWKRFNAGRFRKPVPFLTEMKNCQDSNEAISLFYEYYEMGFKHDYPSYSSLIYKLARARNFEVVATFLDYLRTLDIRCQEALFIALFQHYGKAKMPHQAIELFHKMKSFNCPRTLQSFNTILNGLVDNNCSAEIAEMFKRSSKMGFRPNSVTFNIMIKMWLQKCEWERAKEVFDEMLDREVEPAVVSHNSLIGFLCKKGEFNEAKLLFDDMVKKRRSPNHVTYALLMEGLCFLGKFKEAKNLMFDVEYQGCKPRLQNYGVLMNDLGKRGNIDTFSCLFVGLVKSSNLDSAGFILEEMEKINMRFELESWESLVAESCRDGTAVNELVTELISIASS